VDPWIFSEVNETEHAFNTALAIESVLLKKYGKFLPIWNCVLKIVIVIN